MRRGFRVAPEDGASAVDPDQPRLRAIKFNQRSHDMMTSRQLRLAINRLGLTQAETAALIGYAPRTMRHWLADRTPVPPSAAILIRLLARGKLRMIDVEKAKQ